MCSQDSVEEGGGDCKLSPLGDKSGCLVAATRVLHNPTKELEGGRTAAIDFTIDSPHCLRRHQRLAASAPARCA